MAITIEQIKELRDKTGISIMQCRKALEEAGGDIEKAIIILQKRSAAAAEKKNDRTLGAGIIAAYIHAGGGVGSLVELSSETDFVSNTKDFGALAYDIAMHVAASNPTFLSYADIPKDEISQAKEVFMKEVKGKPESMKEKILEGKLKSYFSERTLLDQLFIKETDRTVGDLIKQAVQKFGERIEIRRFARFSTK